jgi:hypothetical protein
MGHYRGDRAVHRVADLVREIDALERNRSALLDRIEAVRSGLIEAADRIATLRGLGELLKDHVATAAAAAAELKAIENEARETGVAVTRLNSDSLGLIFEADSLKETLSDAEEEMERALSSFIEGRSRKLRGH